MNVYLVSVIVIVVAFIVFRVIRRLSAIIWIYVRKDGKIFFLTGKGGGEWISRERLRSELVNLKGKGYGEIHFSRAEPDRDPSSVVQEILDFIVGYNIPVKYVEDAPYQIQMMMEPFKKALTGNIPPLIRAVMEKKTGKVRELLEQGEKADITFDSPKCDALQLPLISIAAVTGDVETAKLLGEYGADINAPNGKGVTPLMFAGAGGHPPMVSLLVEQNVRLEDKDNFGNTALAGCVVLGEVDCVKILLDHGDNPNVTYYSLDSGGIDDNFVLSVAVAKDYVEIFDCLLDAGAKVDAAEKDGYTALLLASGIENTYFFNTLVEKGANTESKNEKGLTALMMAAFNGQDDRVGMLLNHGADVQAVDFENSTAIMMAAQFGHNDTVSLLLEHGADPTKENDNGLSAVGIARKNNMTDTVTLIEEWLQA